MKKTFRFLLAAVCLLGIASCADVPELPYPVPDPNGGGGGGKTASGLPFTSASLNNFEVKTIEGIDWSLGSSYAKASGYDNNTKSTTATKTWLVSPAINTTVTGTSADGSNTDGIIISFDHVLRYVKSSTDVKGWHKVLASKDYAGDVTTATWIDLNFQPVESSTNDWTFYPANPVILPAELWNEEKVYIAFYFQCDATNSTTWELKNLTVKEGMTPDPLPGPTPGDGKLPFAQEFSNDFGSFVPVDVNGPDSWVIDFKTAKMTGYDGTNRNANEDWLISCPIDLSDVSSAKLIMNYIYRYKVSDEDITVWASKSFNGSSITPSDWTQVKGNQLVEGKDWNTFSNTEFDLTPFVGDKIYVAVKYVSVAGSASTIEIKKITIEEGQAVINGDTPSPGPTPSPGENILENGDFESWTAGLPDNWKSTTSASNATLSQSTDAHNGNYSVKIACDEKNNKRMAYKELTLKSGTYTVQFYAKGVSSEASIRPGYAIVEDGSINSSSGYKYGSYTNNISTDTWTLVSHTFTLSAETVVNLLIMNPKTSNNSTAADVLIDDYELSTSDGGIVGDDNTNPDPTPGDALFSADFTKGENGFTIYNVEMDENLSYVWAVDSRYGWKASAFKDNTRYPSDSYIVSPSIDLTSASSATLSFSHAARYFGESATDFLSVLVTTSFDGDVAKSSWVSLMVPSWPTGADWNFYDSDDISLAGYAGQKIYIAFRYTSNSSIAATWEIKSISVK